MDCWWQMGVGIVGCGSPGSQGALIPAMPWFKSRNPNRSMSTVHQPNPNRGFQLRLRRAEKHLRNACPSMADFISASGRCELTPEWQREPMEALVRAVAHQQLHGRAAQAILGRLVALFPEQPFPQAGQLLKLRTPKFRSLGFSAAKVETIRCIAKAAIDGIVPTRELADQLADEELIERLVALRGIGRWTVEMLLIFTLGRLDVMPVDDFGVRSGLSHLYKLEATPKAKDFERLTADWSPYRSVGAWYLWRVADAAKVK